MKDAVIHITKIVPGKTLASARIATFIQKVTGAIMIDDVEIASKHVKYRNLFVVNGPTAFCPFRKDIETLTRLASRVIWVQNDYTIYPASQMKRALRDRWPVLQARNKLTRCPIVWTTVPFRCTEEHDAYINWNALTYEPVDMQLVGGRDRKQGLFYYGANRVGRRKFFDTYLNTDRYPVTISTSARTAKEFQAISKHAEIVPPFSSMIELATYGATVYMADEYSNREYTSPANRFYECLSAGVAQFIDYGTVDTLTQTGFEVRAEWVVKDATDVARLLCKSRQIAKEQAKVWRGPHKKNLEVIVRREFKKLNSVVLKKGAW